MDRRLWRMPRLTSLSGGTDHRLVILCRPLLVLFLQQQKEAAAVVKVVNVLCGSFRESIKTAEESDEC